VIWLAVGALAALTVLWWAAVGWWHHHRYAAYLRFKGAGAPASGWSVLWAELVDTLRLSGFFARSLGRDGWLEPELPAGRPVLCVHGYTQNGTNFWGIRQRLLALGRPSRAVSMVPGVARMNWYAARLERTLEEVVEQREGSVDVICHSMGGVVLRMVLARRPDLARRVAAAVTLGSPHAGTAAARGIPWLPEVQALKRRSVLLAELPPLTELVQRVVTVAGTLDTVVYPLDSALVDGAEQVVLPVGHAGLLTAPAAVEVVVRAVEGGVPAPR
jgi:pimeloyl-ACP methyl ester carboxylesterase